VTVTPPRPHPKPAQERLAFRADDVTPPTTTSVTVRWRDAHW
jgi:hypothetical protein